MSAERFRWITSSRSNNGGQSVEVATGLAATTGTVPVRDSKNPTGAILTVPADAFTHFVHALTSAAFDH